MFKFIKRISCFESRMDARIENSIRYHQGFNYSSFILDCPFSRWPQLVYVPPLRPCPWRSCLAGCEWFHKVFDQKMDFVSSYIQLLYEKKPPILKATSNKQEFSVLMSS